MTRKNNRKLVLQAIKDLTKENGFPPTFREIAAEVDMFHSAVVVHVDKLAEEGLLTRQPKIARSITLTKD